MSQTASNTTSMFTELIEERFAFITDNLVAREPKSLYEPIGYIMRQRGKRIRPMLMITSCHMFGGDIHHAMDPSYGIELFHNFTLIHDDIMDNAAVRRGMPTIHEKYGLQSGILSGDTAMMVSARHIMDTRADIAATAQDFFLDCGIKICEGQQWDIDFETRMDVEVDEYIRMIEYKTGVLLACSLKLGAMIAGADQAQQDAMYEFGRNIGIAFQLQDDYLDTFGDYDKVGKRIGGDIAQNKKTFLLIRALQKADADRRERLERYLEMPSDSKAKITETVRVFRELEIDTETKSAMEAYYDDALELLNSVDVVNEDGRRILRSIAEKIIQRDH